MRIVNILALGAIGISASGAEGKWPEWHATNYGMEYSSGGTIDHVHIHGKAPYGLPSFSAECTSNNHHDTWQKCKSANDAVHVSHYFTYGEKGKLNEYFLYKAEGKKIMGVATITPPRYGQEKNFTVGMLQFPTGGDDEEPAGSPGQGPTLKPWKVTDFEMDYAPGGTQSILHIAGKADYGMPAFSVKCWASSYDKTYRKCTGNVAKGARVSHYWTFTRDPGYVNLFFKYTANGKTLIAGRLAKMLGENEGQDFKAYPAPE